MHAIKQFEILLIRKFKPLLQRHNVKERDCEGSCAKKKADNVGYVSEDVPRGHLRLVNGMYSKENCKGKVQSCHDQVTKLVAV